MALPTSIRNKVVVGLLSLSAAGALGIMSHEGVVKVAYKDPVGIVTVCAGNTATAKLGQVKSDAQCVALFKQDADYATQAVKRLVTVPVTQRQFNSLVSFVFNVGEGNFSKSTLLKKINSYDCYGAGNEFLRWDKAKGRVLPGLTKRRIDERNDWNSGCSPLASLMRRAGSSHFAYA